MTFDFVIKPTGDVVAIYNDAALPIWAGLGFTPADVAARTQRASHVEPGPTGWTADMAPVGGPVLGPFDTRQTALDAEVAWLRAHL